MGRIAGVTAEETRARILESANRLFAERGFAGTRTRAVAEAAGVNVASIAYHFKDKQGLYDAVVDGVYADLEQLGEGFELSGPDLMGSAVEAVWAFAQAHRDGIRVLARIVIEHGALPERVTAAWLGGRLAAFVSMLAAAVRRSEAEVRLRLISMNYLIARYVMNSPEELCRVVGIDSEEPEAAHVAVVAHLKEVGRALLGPPDMAI